MALSDWATAFLGLGGPAMLNYDPDGTPQMDPTALAEAQSLGLHPIHVICDEPGAKVGDPAGVSFFAFVSFVPRIGERIKLQDGGICEVERVFYKVTPTGKFITMFPNVAAIRVKDL
jgi:hypothetical protein